MIISKNQVFCFFYGMAFWNCIRSHIDISRPSEISTFAYLLYIHSVVRCCVVCIENGNNERVGREAHKNYSNNWEEIDLTGLKDLSIKSTHGYSHQINDRSLKSWAVHWCWGLTAPWCGPGSTYLTCYYISNVNIGDVNGLFWNVLSGFYYVFRIS